MQDAALLRVQVVAHHFRVRGDRVLGEFARERLEFDFALLPEVVHLELQVVARTIPLVEEAVEQVLQRLAGLALAAVQQIVVAVDLHGHVHTIAFDAHADLGLEAHLGE